MRGPTEAKICSQQIFISNSVFPMKCINITDIKKMAGMNKLHCWNTQILKQCHALLSTSTSNKQPKKIIDMRSDTVTKPSPEMLHAMFSAEVGDDVYKEDPAVNELEEKCAHLFGKERALFVPSGTMGNLICLLAHCTRRGDSVIIGSNQHVCCREQGNYTQYGSIPTRTLPNNPDGTISLRGIAASINDGCDFHQCRTKLVCLENTHMRCGGIPLTWQYTEQVAQLARCHDMSLHVDGARIFNAAVALDCDVSLLLRDVDSVSMCFSKGLGCPVGSVIGGSDRFIQSALRIRKGLGGGMRQAGYLAAAGLYALDNARSVVENDHRTAQRLALGIKSLGCPSILDVDVGMVRTNLLLVSTKEGLARRVVDQLKAQSVLCGVFDSSTIRFATHLDVGEEDVDVVLNSLQKIIHQFHQGGVIAL